MAENTKIEWADDTLNLWLGCEKISPACTNCYAEGWARRSGLVKWGVGAERRKTSAATWNQIERFARLAEAEGRPRRVFVNSLSDFFEDNPQVADWRAEAFERFKRYPMLQFLLLTKRANNIAPSLPADWGSGYPNVWLGCTVENQSHDWRIGFLREVPAVVRFLSCEPLLSEIRAQWHGIDWVIAGGESGANARPMHPDWVRSLRDQCQAAGVAFHFKQWGSWQPFATAASYQKGSVMSGTDEVVGGDCGGPASLDHFDEGSCMAHWYDREGERVRSLRAKLITVDAHRWGKNNLLHMQYLNVGKKVAGRLLDGRTWDEFPEVSR